MPTELLDEAEFPPAPAQGAICIESRIGDRRVNGLLEAINDLRTHEAVTCERAFLSTLDGSCRTPIAGHAVSDGETLRFFGMILTPDGSRFHRISAEGKASDAAETGEKAGTDIRVVAGADFFTSWT